MFDYTPYVQNGIAFLDKYGKEGWRDCIDWSKLDVYSTTRCVAGQSMEVGDHYSGYSHAMHIIGESNTRDGTNLRDHDFGFNTRDDDDWDEDGDWFFPTENLVNTWRRELGVA